MSQNSNSSKEPVELSLKSAAKILLLLGGAVLFLKLFTLILLLFLGCMLSVVLDPFCRRIERLKIRRTYAVGLIALGLFGILVAFAAFIIPAVTTQLASLMGALPQIRADLLHKIPDGSAFKTFVEDLLNSSKLPDTSRIVEHGMNIVGGAAQIIAAFALVWIFSVYLLADGRRALQWFSDFFSAPTRIKINATAQETAVVISAYATGQFINSATCAIFCYGILTLLDVPAALTLALLAGAFDIVPIVGFFIALIPAALLGYSVSPQTGLIVIVLYTIYHLIESYLIVPTVYGKSMKVSGLVVILALLVGVSIGGILLGLAILPLVASYPIIERIWLIKFLGRDVVNRHLKASDQRVLPDQVKMWDVSRLDFQRSTTLTNRDLSKHFKRRILIVEDDPDIRDMLQDILQTEGYHTFIASNGNEALTTLEAETGIGLVLMDINMPVMDGRKLFESMKQHPIYAKIPVVFLSASDDTDHDIAGAAGVLKKPSRLEDVISTVERLYRRTSNE